MATLMLDGNLYKEMVVGGARNLGYNAEIVNDLNVFPIPDGDTGDNMRMTVEGGAASAANAATVEIGEMAKIVADGMLLSARGNSGVILSQFFGGIAKGLEGVAAADAAALGRAFESGVKQAYNAVMTPTEGTILTVARESTAYAVSRIERDSTPETFLSDFIDEMHASLERTPDLLPVLKEAGVIDSGGAGLVYVMEGMNKILHGEPLEGTAGALPGNAKTVDTSGFTADSVMEFGYCTECLLQLQNSKVDTEAFDVATISDYLKTIGNSIVAVKTGSIVKLHVHTMTPGKVFEFCQQYGEFLTVKVENMSLQHSEATVENRYTPAPKKATENKPRKKIGIVAVASGDGIAETFRQLGADVIVPGGQTMNPSAEDFVEAFREANADTVIVMPNNGNIILAARAAAGLYRDSDVRVLESHTIGDGYAALSMMDFDSKDTDEIMQNLRDAMNGVTTASVTYAVRDTHLGGMDIHAGDFIGITGKELLSCEKDAASAAKAMFGKLDMTDKEVIIVICGKDATREDMDDVRADLKARFPAVEIYEIDGKQDIYQFIFVVE